MVNQNNEIWVDNLARYIKDGMKLGYYDSYNSVIYKDGKIYESAKNEETEEEIDKKRTLLKFKDINVSVPLHEDGYTQPYLGARISGYYDEGIETFKDIPLYEEDNISSTTELKKYANKLAKKLNIKDFKSNINKFSLISLTHPRGLYEDGGFVDFQIYNYDEEVNFIESKPFVKSVTMGPRILRAETAAVSALSVWQACVGDWNQNEVKN